MQKEITTSLVPAEIIQSKIYWVRGHKVMIDRDLAELYGVETHRLNEQVKRNLRRFPEDFMFQLTKEESENLISQNAISSWGGVRKLGYAFTEQGVAMLSSVLRSDRAIEVNIQIMRVFVRIKELMLSHKDLAHKIEELERKYDKNFVVVFEAIEKLISSPTQSTDYKRRKVGFIVEE